MIKKIFRFVLLSVIILIVVAAGFLINEQKKEAVRDEAELSYGANGPWNWYDKYYRIQISKREDADRSVLRKVHLKDKYIVYAFKNDDFSLTSFVKFVVDCKPGTTITTSKSFDDGAAKMLKCNESGTGLIYSVLWHGRDTDVTWVEDLDGFKVYENFSNWDFSVLEKELSLNNAK